MARFMMMEERCQQRPRNRGGQQKHRNACRGRASTTATTQEATMKKPVRKRSGVFAVLLDFVGAVGSVLPSS
jgi:hypothetical protein